MRRSIRLMAVAGGILALIGNLGCDDKGPTGPSISGDSPEFLTGIWKVVDSTRFNEIFAPSFFVRQYIDTICPNGPAFGFEDARRVWRMHQNYFGIDSTQPNLEFCQGFISDTAIDVYCFGESQFEHPRTHMLCTTQLTFRTWGKPKPNTWILTRSVERAFTGEACDWQSGDTLRLDQQYISYLERIGDAPDSCSYGEGSNALGKQ